MTRIGARVRLLTHQVPPVVRTAILYARWRLKGSPRVTSARPTVAPATSRLLVAPANFAGQGFGWSRAVAAHVPDASATCLEISAGTLSMPCDQRIAPVVADGDRDWARGQLAWVRGAFSHVLLEAGRPLFGPLLHRDVLAEVAALREGGLGVAMIAHGTDVRLPSRHAAREPWSPFVHGVLGDLPLREHRARAVTAVFTAFDGPTFVSTPDLLDDLEGATWCPVAVELGRWASLSGPSAAAVPTVMHVPSRGPIKGSELVDPLMARLDRAGVIRYRRSSHTAAVDMPAVMQTADIVLDQFRIGSYGVAACEAMAAGRVVVGHVRAEVRERVRELTGIDLPIVEATPNDVEDVVATLAASPEDVRRIGHAGLRYVQAVHDGRASAEALRGWLTG